MVKYQPTINIWVSPFPALHVGQWVSAGPPQPDRLNCGQYMGTKPSGTVVVAWNGNARAYGDPVAYRKDSYRFARGG